MASSAEQTGKRLRPTFAEIGLPRIRAVVDDFYDRIQRHPTLAEPFGIVSDWDEHKAHLTHFWWISLGGPRFRPDGYNLIDKHAPVGVTPALIDDWLALFAQTLADHLPPELAAAWLERAVNMGRSLRLMCEFYQEQQPTS
ncbi:MAG: group III truncated hemoglobin [Pseudomonadota bacterium]